MIKFEFKYNTWTNQKLPPSYNPTAPLTGGTTPTRLQHIKLTGSGRY
jgi:hypothetical protein